MDRFMDAYSKVSWLIFMLIPSITGILASITGIGYSFRPILLSIPTLFLVLNLVYGIVTIRRFNVEYALMSSAGFVTLAHRFYFEGLIVMFLYSLAELIEDIAELYAKRRLDKLIALIPSKVIVDAGGSHKIVSSDSLKYGDVVIVRHGEAVPCDGIALSEGYVNTSLITGESEPRYVTTGDYVSSGYINVSGNLMRVKVLRPISKSTLYRIVELALESLEEKSLVERVLDKLLKPWAVIAYASFIVAYILTDPLRAVSIFIVACPSAFIINSSFSAAYTTAILARRGIVVRGGRALEAIARVDTIILDKTGTLTLGDYEITRIKPPDNIDEEYFKSIIASLASVSLHPLSRTLSKISQKKLQVDNFSEKIGLGVEGVVDSRRVVMGSSRLLNLNSDYKPCSELESTIYISIDGDLGYICLKEYINPKTINVISNLNERIIIASGDKRGKVESIARMFGVREYYYEMSPEDKMRLVNSIREQGKRVLAVGDGVNDIVALAVADAGVAVGNIDAVVAVADAVLVEGVHQLPDIIRESRVHMSTLIAALTIAVIVKIVALTGGLTGLLPLWLVALLGDDGATILGLLTLILTRHIIY
ncbi:MAG: heavy metal translocating P-type ATPase [Acidilobaceae archaeon]